MHNRQLSLCILQTLACRPQNGQFQVNQRQRQLECRNQQRQHESRQRNEHHDEVIVQDPKHQTQETRDNSHQHDVGIDEHDEIGQVLLVAFNCRADVWNFPFHPVDFLSIWHFEVRAVSETVIQLDEGGGEVSELLFVLYEENDIFSDFRDAFQHDREGFVVGYGVRVEIGDCLAEF
jgi:hypothetical protein